MTDLEVEKRRALVASAVRVVMACHPLPEASPDESRAYQNVLESRGIEAVLVAEPKWTKRRGPKRSFLFKVAYNKATTEAKKYVRAVVRGDEVDDDRTGGASATPEEQVELREELTDARSWQLALVRRMGELTESKPHYRVALLAYQEKASSGYGFLARAAERLGMEVEAVEKAMDAFKKRLQRDEVITRLRRTAPEQGLLAVLDDAAELDQHTAAPEVAEDFDDVDDADRADHRGDGTDAGLARPAGGEPGPAAGPDARGAAGAELDADDEADDQGRGERAGGGEEGRGERHRDLTVWLTFPVGRPAGCRARTERRCDAGQPGAAASQRGRCRSPGPSGLPRPRSPAARVTTGLLTLTGTFDRWGAPARAAPS